MSAAAEPEFLDLDRVRLDPTWALKLPPNLAVRRQVLPFAVADEVLYVACADPSDEAALEAVSRYTGLPTAPRRAEPESLRRALERVYPDPTKSFVGAGPAARTGEADDDAIALTEELLHQAVLRHASDMHIEPDRDGVTVRLRIDGVLEELRRVSVAKQAGLVSRLKVLAGMDIAERRAPQDGAFSWKFGPRNQPKTVDIRMATIPTKFGERATLRLLALQTENLTLERLGMSPADLDLFSRTLAAPHGILVLTGPTGSGKTSTLYAAMRQMDRKSQNIVTIEDPIEYELKGVSQIEVDQSDKVSFAKALRSVLRHDPDVIMLGEIRDLETADVAIKASLTGHLVLSTLHTNSAVGAVTRLTDMGIAPFLAAATLRLSVAQRLVRRLCPHCRKPTTLDRQHAAALGRPEAEGRSAYLPGGCAYCGGRGYAGRLGVFEMLAPDAEIADLITNRAAESRITERAVAKGMRLLRDDAFEKVLAGTTSAEEAVNAVVGL